MDFTDLNGFHRFFLVRNYKPFEKNSSLIDSFAFGPLDQDYSQLDDYKMIFYKD
jgi:hypothetical protein